MHLKTLGLMGATDTNKFNVYSTSTTNYYETHIIDSVHSCEQKKSHPWTNRDNIQWILDHASYTVLVNVFFKKYLNYSLFF